MPPDPSDRPILARPAFTNQELWTRLKVASWPLPLALLPGGTALVGGAVRDGLMGRLGERPDLDLVVPGDGLALAQSLAKQLNGTAVVLDRERAIGRLVLKGWTIDLAGQQGGSLTADLFRRDYSVNAMALQLPIGSQDLVLLDPLDGKGDLQRRQLRAISEANLLADPLRLLRGLRLASELGFSLEAETWTWIVRHRTTLASVAGERVLAELQRLVSGAEGARGVDLLQQSGLLQAWQQRPPGMIAATAHLTVEQARLRGFTEEESARALSIARLTALLDEETLSRLHASNNLRRRCRQLRRWRQRLARLEGSAEPGLATLPEAEQLELHRQMDADLPALLLELAVPVAEAALPRWRDATDPLFHPQPPLDGLALQQHLGLTPGPRLGELLDHLAAERAFGRLPREDPSCQKALRVAQDWLNSTGGPCRD